MGGEGVSDNGKVYNALDGDGMSSRSGVMGVGSDWGDRHEREE